MRANEIYRYRLDLEELSNQLDRRAPDIENIVDNLNSVSRLSEKRGFNSIGEEASEYEANLRKDKDIGEGILPATLTANEKSDLTQQVQRWIGEYEQLTERIITYTPQTDIDVDNLSQGPQSFLDIELDEEYEAELRDLTEACTSLISGAYTSAEFMALRAIEGLLRKWYESEMGESAKNRGWNEVFSALDDSEETDELQGMNLLDILRNRRNEVAHPDRHSTKRDAETTVKHSFTITERLVEQMTSET